MKLYENTFKLSYISTHFEKFLVRLVQQQQLSYIIDRFASSRSKSHRSCVLKFRVEKTDAFKTNFLRLFSRHANFTT